MDQQVEKNQMRIESKIRAKLMELYLLLQASDRPEAEEQLGFVAAWKAFWEGDHGSVA